MAFISFGSFYYFQKKSQVQGVDIPYVKANYSMPVFYDPAQMNDGASLIFSELVYEGLLRFTEDYGVQPGVAKSWETSKDGKTITFTIDDKARFHNGDEITAKDIVVSLNRVLAPESKVYKYYDMILGAKEYHSGNTQSVSGINAINKNIVEIRLKDAFPPILYVLAGGTAKILPERLINQKDFFSKPIGSGPFLVSKIGKENIILKRFENYHGDKPKLETFVLRSINQAMAMEEAKKGKLHDLSSWPLSGMEEVFKNGQDIHTIVADTWIVGFNTRIAPLNDLKVRTALKHSIDSEKFRKMFYPSAVRAFGYVPPGFPGYVEKENKSEEVIVPKHSPITITIDQGLNKAKEMANFFEKNLKNKGWKIQIELMKWSEMMKRYEEKTLQSFLVSMIIDYPDAEFLLNNFASSNPDNYSGIKDKKIDFLIAEARGLQDRIKRFEIYKKLAKRVNGLALSANLFHSRPHYWIHKCVRNFRPNLLAVAYIDYRKVSFDYDCLREERREQNSNI